MTIRRFRGGGRFEEAASYVRAKRVGPFVSVAGTTAIEPSGRIHAPNDSYKQTLYILGRIRDALDAVGAEMRHVMRSRVYLSSGEHVGGLVRAHGEVFKDIEPVTTAVVAALSQPGLVVEIDVDAIVHDESGAISH